MDRYAYWRNAQTGRFAAIVETDPQPGFYRMKSGGGVWLPVAIWDEDVGEGATTTWVQVAKEEPSVDLSPGATNAWLRCAKHPVSEENYRHAVATGRWLSDPPAQQTPADAPPSEPGPGHNSADPASFEAMCAELTNDAAEAVAHFAKHPLVTKDDADKCENWRKRIAEAVKKMDASRKALNEPLQAQIDANNARYFPPIRDAEAKAQKLKGLGDAWVNAERARLRKIAEEKARAEREAAWAAEKKAAEEAAQHVRAQGIAVPPLDLPEAPPASMPLPIVETPDVLIGTSGRRRGATSAPATATITDLAAAAAYYAEQRDPDLIELIQRLANRAARAKARIPGCRMSWESAQATA